MNFENLDALIAMDGHGGYVWSSYALALLVVTLIIVLPLRKRRRFMREHASRLKRNGLDRGPGEGGLDRASTGQPASDTP